MAYTMLTDGLKDDEVARLDAALFEGALDDGDWQSDGLTTVAEA